ncbi:FadR/GntR family transcriptional regulator [Fluviibacterium sp. DFM31]|uniref:FadR/GntR family transcriptional regulator n=1 Tax=Meridianimarinicoccus marinus TaxID=3231483 RepID=A0ABV3L969_9RHOB
MDLTAAGKLFDGQAPVKDRLENQVYRQLLDKIRFGNFAMGERLPSEAELCSEYGVSRPVVRAALSKLRDSGLIVSRRGAGSFVNSGVGTDTQGFEPLHSIDDIACFFAFRRAIEASSVELAAENATAAGIAMLRETVEDSRNLLNKGDIGIAADIKFHTKIAELSDSRFLIETIDMLRPHWMFIGNFVTSLGITGARTGERMIGEHHAIIDAIEAGDPIRARDAMVKHIRGSERRVFKGG